MVAIEQDEPPARSPGPWVALVLHDVRTRPQAAAGLRSNRQGAFGAIPHAREIEPGIVLQKRLRVGLCPEKLAGADSVGPHLVGGVPSRRCADHVQSEFCVSRWTRLE